MKHCSKCNKTKEEGDFYASNYWCKECCNERNKRWRRENPEKARALSRKAQLAWAHKNKEKVKQYRKNWENKNPEYAKEWSKQSHRKNPLQRFAHHLVRQAINRGSLIKEPCWFCGSLKRIEAHHEDYELPYDVAWLCKSHHRRWEEAVKRKYVDKFILEINS